MPEERKKQNLTLIFPRKNSEKNIAVGKLKFKSKTASTIKSISVHQTKTEVHCQAIRIPNFPSIRAKLFHI